MKVFSLLVVILGVLFLLLLSFGLYTYLYYSPYTASSQKILNYKDEGIILTDRNNTPFYFVNNAKADDFVKLDDVSPFVPRAIIAAEDRTFYQHSGFP